jgi:hypothetical protein
VRGFAHIGDWVFLSVLDTPERVLHYVVRYRDGLISVSDRRAFPSIQELVAYYRYSFGTLLILEFLVFSPFGTLYFSRFVDPD